MGEVPHLKVETARFLEQVGNVAAPGSILTSGLIVMEMAMTDQRLALIHSSVAGNSGNDLAAWQIMGLLAGTYEEVKQRARNRRTDQGQ